MFEAFKSRKSMCDVKLNEDASAYKLSEFVKMWNGADVTPCGAIFTEKGKYGKSVGLVIDADTLVWLPKRYVEKFEALTEEEIEALKAGKVHLTNFRDHDGQNGKTIVFDLVCDEDKDK